MKKILRLVCFCALVVLVLSSPGQAGNSMSFSDPIGDNEPGAADVQAVVVSNKDDGSWTIQITLGGQPRLGPADFVGVFIDNDQDPKTGSSGSEYVLEALGTTGASTYRFCVPSGSSLSCTPETFGTDTQLGATSHRLEFALTTTSKSDFSWNFWVGAVYTDPTGKSFFDLTDTWTYNFVLSRDSDGDGVKDSLDKCPATSAGQYDTNHNGCPGPFPLIKLGPPNARILATSDSARFTWLRWGSAPPGTSFLLRSGSLRETFKANQDGVASSRRFKGPFRIGTIFILRATKPGLVGYYGKIRLDHSGLRVVKHLCIPARGSTDPTSCRPNLRGS
jgi:hypothetical protein